MHDVRPVDDKERDFLARAQAMFREHIDWFAFEDFAFSMRSPVFAKTRAHENILDSALYLALKDMWLQLGIQQGRISATEKEKKLLLAAIARSLVGATEPNGSGCSAEGAEEY